MMKEIKVTCKADGTYLIRYNGREYTCRDINDMVDKINALEKEEAGNDSVSVPAL